MVPATSEDIQKEYEILLGELEKYNPQLLSKARLLAITKCDVQPDELPNVDELSSSLGLPVVLISSVSGMGIATLKDMLWE
jgi:GTP-binding protein